MAADMEYLDLEAEAPRRRLRVPGPVRTDECYWVWHEMELRNWPECRVCDSPTSFGLDVEPWLK